MRRRSKALVLDTWSVVAYFEDEPSGEQVADLIADAQESGASLAMSVVNAGELWHLMARRSSEADASESVTAVRQLGIQLVEIDWNLAQAAARLSPNIGCRMRTVLRRHWPNGLKRNS